MMVHKCGDDIVPMRRLKDSSAFRCDQCGHEVDVSEPLPYRKTEDGKWAVDFSGMPASRSEFCPVCKNRQPLLGKIDMVEDRSTADFDARCHSCGVVLRYNLDEDTVEVVT